MFACGEPRFEKTSLFLGNLDPSIDEMVIFNTFRSMGTIKSIKLCKDMMTQESLGSAYINFENPADAKRVMEMMKRPTIKGKPMKIDWAHKTAKFQGFDQNNVFINHLEKSIDNKALHDTFSTFGEIISWKVAYDDNGSKGYGYVHFETDDSAELAIEKLNGKLINGQIILVEKYLPKKDRENDTASSFTNVFVKNFGDLWNDKTMHDAFLEFGAIVNAKVQTDHSGKKLGFGFVNFETSEAAEKAVSEMCGRIVDDRVIWAGPAKSKAKRQAELHQECDQMKVDWARLHKNMNLYVKNLDDAVDADRLRLEFSVYGTVTSAKVMHDVIGRSKGFGFVCFSSPEEATKAVTKMNGRIIMAKPLYVAFAQRKEDRGAHLTSQYMQRAAQSRQQTMRPSSRWQNQMRATPQVPPVMPMGMQQIRQTATARQPQTGQQVTTGGLRTTMQARPITGANAPTAAAQRMMVPGRGAAPVSIPAGAQMRPAYKMNTMQQCTLHTGPPMHQWYKTCQYI